MARVLKIIGGLLFALIILSIAIVLYIFRAQTIDFTNFMPPKIEFCGEEITTEHIEHKKLTAWFKTNQKGWKPSPVSYVPNYIYSSSDFRVLIDETGMVVSYKEGTNFQQVTKTANTNGLVSKCD